MKRHLVLPLVLATGCVSAPAITRPQTQVTVPEAWTAGDADAAGDDVGATWWADFGDAALDEAIARALEHNSEILAAAARVGQAEAAARIAGADLKPQLGAGLRRAQQKQNFIGLPIPGAEGGVLSSTSTQYGVSLDLSWEADLWGRLSAAAREGLASFAASQAELAGIRLSIAGQTAKAWFAVAEAHQQVRLAGDTVASFERSAQQARVRFESGVRPALDLRLALTQLATARSTLELRRRQLDAVSRQLEILLGAYPERAMTFPTDLAALPVAIPAGLPAELVARRPDLAAAERRLVASDQRLLGARAALYPRLSLTASGGTASDGLGDLIGGDFSVWSLVGNLVAPLFQGGRLRAGVELADAAVNEAAALYVSAALRAYFEVETALAAESLLAARLAALQEATTQSRAAQALASDRYRNGLETYVTVLESQRRTFDAEVARLAAQRERLDNRIDLYLALGGGFDATENGHPTTDATTAFPAESSR